MSSIRSGALVGLLLISYGKCVQGGDDDDDDGGHGCNRACTVNSIPALTATTYRSSISSPLKFSDQCSPGKIVVTSQPQDGFGGEVLARIAARASAHAHGYIYVHNPFVTLDHVGGQEDFMERFLNLGADEIDIRSIETDYTVMSNKDFDWNSPGGASCQIFYACTNSKGCMGDGGSSHIIPGDMEDIRARYRRGVKPALPLNSSEYNVAVHMRRGDVERKVATEQELLVTIAQIRTTVASDAGTKPVRFHVFTQGAPGSLPLMALESDITLHIDANTVQHSSSTSEVAEALQVAYHSFVMADALVATASALSYSAAMFSEGRIFAYHHDRPKRADWTMVNDDGTFSEEQAARSARKTAEPPPYVLTTSPTQAPTLSPTHAPTLSPTHAPTLSPTHALTSPPTRSPTSPPTRSPTSPPTRAPTTSLTHAHTATPFHDTTSPSWQTPTSFITSTPFRNESNLFYSAMTRTQAFIANQSTSLQELGALLQERPRESSALVVSGLVFGAGVGIVFGVTCACGLAFYCGMRTPKAQKIQYGLNSFPEKERRGLKQARADVENPQSRREIECLISQPSQRHKD